MAVSGFWLIFFDSVEYPFVEEDVGADANHCQAALIFRDQHDHKAEDCK